MDMAEWARREVEIACKRETQGQKDGAWDYGCACYESALKAYLSLMEDNHSGMSFSFTKEILTRLMDGKPLTPIEDVPGAWIDVSWEKNGQKHYQCRRMSSLFKKVDTAGKVTYSDVRRVVCCNRGEHIPYSSGHATKLVDELYPITMPYDPPIGKYRLTCEEWLTDRKHGDFDTWAYLTMKTPDGQEILVFKYFKDDGNGAVEIDVNEYGWRRMAHKKREEEEAAGDRHDP